MLQDHDIYYIIDILGHLLCHTFPASPQKVLLLKMLFKPNDGMVHNFRIFQAFSLENNDSILYESISFWLMYKYLRET